MLTGGLRRFCSSFSNNFNLTVSIELAPYDATISACLSGFPEPNYLFCSKTLRNFFQPQADMEYVNIITTLCGNSFNRPYRWNYVNSRGLPN